MSIVEINRVFKRYGDGMPAVRGVDLRIDDGEFLVLVGPSGCGKTSILRMVAGLEPVSSGSILVDGEPVSDAERGGRRAAMMFQEPTVYPHMSVRQNLEYPLRVAGADRQTVDTEVEAIARLLGLVPLLPRWPHQLSGGQRQRVAMGRALIRHPGLLLMDEPLSNVDAQRRVELRAAIGHLHQRFGITTLSVTHDQVEAMSLGDRIAVMLDGRIVQCGTPLELYRAPVDAFVATFIGQPGMNLFHGRLSPGVGGPMLTVGSAALRLGDSRWRGLDATAEHDVVVGVRPQSFHFADDGIVADVESASTVGDRRFVEVTLPTRPVTVFRGAVIVGEGSARVTVDVSADDRVGDGRWRPSHLGVDADEIHLFDTRTGRTLAPRAEDLAAGHATRATT